MTRGAFVVVALLVAGSLGEDAGHSASGGAAQAFLGRTFGLSPDDLRQIDNGRVLSRSLDADDKREVATLGIVRVAVTSEVYAARLRDISSFKQGDAVLQIGTFSSPAVIGDVRNLTLEPSDVSTLRKCRVNDCGLQLPAAFIDRFRIEVDWNSRGADEQANAVMRSSLVDYVAAYRSSSAEPSMTYADQPPGLDVSSEFRNLVESDARVLPQFVDMRNHLLRPTPAATGITDVVYWSKEKVGRKGVISVTHLAIARQSGASPAAFVAASKQLYASHYFDSSLGVTMLLPVGPADAAGTYVVYLNRSRVDAFGGFFGGVTRRIVRSRVRGALSDSLVRLKARLERNVEAPAASPPKIPSDRSPAQTASDQQAAHRSLPIDLRSFELQSDTSACNEQAGASSRNGCRTSHRAQRRVLRRSAISVVE